MKITDNGRAFVQTPEFAEALINFMHESEGPHELITEHVIRIICLSLCEISPDAGPELDSPELDSFVIEYQREIESASREFLTMLNAMRKRVKQASSVEMLLGALDCSLRFGSPKLNNEVKVTHVAALIVPW